MDVFDGWARFHKILVTGPQRSGTTIASQMIAADTGHRCVDEIEFRRGQPLDFADFLDAPEPMVIQCPNWCHSIESFARDDRLVVLMVRDPAAIRRSEQRIGWSRGIRNKLRYRSKVAPWTLLRPIAEIRYDHWLRRQRHGIRHYVELDYESLKEHRLWLPPEERRSFGPKQTNPFRAYGPADRP